MQCYTPLVWTNANIHLKSCWLLQVTANHESLLVQAAGVDTLEDKLQTVRIGLDEVTASQDKYVNPILLNLLINSLFITSWQLHCLREY